MKILIVSEKTGVAGSTYSVAYLATGLGKKGHQVFLACPDHSLLSSLVEGKAVTHIPIQINSRFDLQAARHIVRIIEEYEIDIVNAQSGKDRYITIAARWFCDRPFKLIHTRRQLARSMSLISWFYEKGTDKIVAVSQGVKESLVKLGISASHIHVIYNGTPPEKYEYIDLNKVKALREKYHIQAGDIVIGCVSRLKEQHQILKALTKIDKKVKVIFVGIHEQAAYQPIIQQFTIPHEVYFTGSISSEDVLPYYHLFTLNILASTIEGLSQALLEAMALGVPVIATRIGGNPELIEHGKNGLLFDNNDISTLAQQIQDLIDHSGLREKLASNGKKTALVDFSIENTILNYECFFNKLQAT